MITVLLLWNGNIENDSRLFYNVVNKNSSGLMLDLMCSSKDLEIIFSSWIGGAFLFLAVIGLCLFRFLIRTGIGVTLWTYREGRGWTIIIFDHFMLCTCWDEVFKKDIVCMRPQAYIERGIRWQFRGVYHLKNNPPHIKCNEGNDDCNSGCDSKI